MKAIKWTLMVTLASLCAAVPSFAETYGGQAETDIGSATRFELWAPNSFTIRCKPGDVFYINAVVKNAPRNAFSWIEINGERTSQDFTGRSKSNLSNQTAWVADSTEFSVVHFVMHANPGYKDFVGCQLIAIPVLNGRVK